MIFIPYKISDRHYPPDNVWLKNCETRQAIERIDRIHPVDQIQQIQQIQRIQKIQRDRHGISPEFNEKEKRKKGARKGTTKYQPKNAAARDS